MDIHYIDREQVERTISVVPLDSSYRYQELMGEHSVTLNFDLPNFIDFPVGAWIQYENEKYRLFDIPDQNTKQNERHFEYTLIFHDPTAWMSRFKMRNIVDGRLAFTLTAQPQEYIDAIVENLNSRDTGVIWRRGDCIVGTEKTQSFAHNNIQDAITSVAQLFETEWQAVMSGIDGASGKTIYDICLKKVEYNKITAPTNNAQRLMYGKMNGLLPGINRSKGEGNAVDVVWVEGGDRNINSQNYTYQKTIEGQSQTIHANKLHLPTNGMFYYVPSDDETQKGYVYTQAEVDAMPSEQQEQIYSSASIFETDEDGFGLHRRPQDFVNNGFEESLSLTDIYPCLKLNVSEVILEGYDYRETPDVDKYSDRFWNIRAIENPVNYNDYMIGGEEATIIFNSGMLAGKEFNLADTGDGKIYRPTEHEFLIQPTEIDGIVMPDLPINIQDKDGKTGTGYIPQVGDEFAVFHIELPQEYIDKAEKELLLEACNYLYKHGEIEVQFSCNIDGIFSRNKWESIRQYFIIGGYINFVDDDFCRQGRLLRILAIKDYLNRPHAPELTLSNSTISQSVSSELKKVAQNQVFQTKNYADAIQFSKRNFRDVEQAQIKIAEAYSKEIENVSDEITKQLNITNTYFTKSINPVTIQTMSLLIGDKNLQFVFGHAETNSNAKVETWQRYTYEPQWTGSELVCPDTLQVSGGTLAAHVRHDYWTKTQQGITADEVENHPYWIVNASILRSDGDGQPLDSAKAYFLYLQAPKAAASENGFGLLQYSANFHLYAEPHGHTENDFFLLVGILNAEFNGERAYVDMYSSVDINGGKIHADYLGDHDSNFYIDLVNKIIKGDVNIIDGGLAKNFIFGTEVATNYGGITGDDVYYGEHIENFYNRSVRMWIGDGSLLTTIGNRQYLTNARIVFFADGSFLFKLQGKNFYRDVSRTWSLYADGSMRVSEHFDCKKIWASEYLEIGEDNEDTTYFHGTDSHIVGNIRNRRDCASYSDRTINHYLGIVPTVMWHGFVWIDGNSAIVINRFRATKQDDGYFNITLNYDSEHKVLMIYLPDDVEREYLHFNIVKWNYWLSGQGKYGFYNIYYDDIYTVNSVPSIGKNIVYVKYLWDGRLMDMQPFLLTIMYI